MAGRALILIAVLLLVLSVTSAWSQCAVGTSDVLLQGLKTSQPAYPIGQTVDFEFAIRNRTDRTITYSFSSSKQYDLVISRNGAEVFNSCRGVFATVITSLTLAPGQTERFTFRWDQKDNMGQQVGPGAYSACAQLSPSGDRPPAVSARFEVGGGVAAVSPITVADAVARAKEFEGKRVLMSGTYRGWMAPEGDPNIKDGPPVTRSDWVICDRGACMYVTGKIDLRPTEDAGRKITVTGRLQRTSKGQPYLVLENVVIEK